MVNTLYVCLTPLIFGQIFCNYSYLLITVITYLNYYFKLKIFTYIKSLTFSKHVTSFKSSEYLSLQNDFNVKNFKRKYSDIIQNKGSVKLNTK